MITKSKYRLPFDLKTTQMLSTQVKVPLEILELFSAQMKTNPQSLVRRFEKQVGKKKRELYDANDSFKATIQKINAMLQRIKLPPEIYGGIPGKGIKDNALPHLHNKQITKLDITKFFPSLSSKKIRELYLRIGCSSQVASMLTKLTTADGAVPQGFPTSTTLASLCVAVFIYEEIKIATGDKYTITYWVDDITISSKATMPYMDIRKIETILLKQGLSLNRKKTERIRPGQYREVTGVSINGKIGVSKEMYENLEIDLYLLKSHKPSEIVKTRYPREYKERLSHGEDIDKWFIASKKGGLKHVRNLDPVKWVKMNRRYTDVIKTYKLHKAPKSRKNEPLVAKV